MYLEDYWELPGFASMVYRVPPARHFVDGIEDQEIADRWDAAVPG
jgi:hypothetical protein